jgi:hypothetical protein
MTGDPLAFAGGWPLLQYSRFPVMKPYVRTQYVQVFLVGRKHTPTTRQFNTTRERGDYAIVTTATICTAPYALAFCKIEASGAEGPKETKKSSWMAL